MSRVLYLIGFLVLVAAAYVFVVSAGHPLEWPRWSAFYDTQAEGFRAGHLYTTMPERPGVKYWDYSHYGGHWHLYWGLFPAFLLAGLKMALRLRWPVGDEALVFAFLLGRAVAGALLLLAMARRCAPRPSSFAVGLALGVFAFANPTPFLLARAAIYEAALAAGSCFVTVGLWCGLEALFAPDEAPHEAPGEKRARRWLVGASAAFSLAAGARVSLWPAALLLMVGLVVARWRLEGGRFGAPGAARRLVALGACGAAPVTAALLFHLLLNRLRFDAWTEFGLGYQVGFVPHLGARFVPANLFLYLFQPLALGCEFPYLLAKWDTARAATPAWMPWPADYRWTEPSAGLLVAVPYLWLGLGGALWSGIARLVSWRQGSSAPTAWRWWVRWLAVGLAVGAAPVLAMFSLSMRYEVDLVTFALPLAIVGSWRFLEAPASRAGRVVAWALTVAAALATIGVGLALGFTGYFNHFERHNPALMRKFKDELSVCAAPRGAPLAPSSAP
jgi:hypothetical protein